MNARLESPMKEAVGATVVVPAAAGFRIVWVRFADATGPALLTTVPIVAWRLHPTGEVEPIPVPIDDLDVWSLECAIECADWPGVVSQGMRYQTQTLFIEARRDALRERLQWEYEMTHGKRRRAEVTP
jgi:hypothetical protein